MCVCVSFRPPFISSKIWIVIHEHFRILTKELVNIIFVQTNIIMLIVIIIILKLIIMAFNDNETT